MLKSRPNLMVWLNGGLLAPILLSAPVWADSVPLEGRVEETGVVPTVDVAPKPIEPMPVPVIKPRAPLKGKADDAQLQGGADKDALSGQVEDGGQGNPLQPVPGKPDANEGRLK